jgi:virginiamycin B lyase
MALVLPITSAEAAGPPPCRSDCAEAMSTPEATSPFGITAGPLGSIWFSLGDRIGRIDQQGHEHTYLVPSGEDNVGWLQPAAGVVWFSERSTDKVGRIGPNGSIREYQLPGAGIQGIVLPGNGFVYIAEQFSGDIARLDPTTGQVKTYTVPDGGDPLGMAMGADGAIWFIERAAARVGRMTLDGQFSAWNLAPGAFPNRLILGQDGAIWFTELFAGKIGRITSSGHLTEYPVTGGPVGITEGNDGQIYTAMFLSAEVARINLHGQVTGRWALPGGQGPLQITAGFGHDIWTTDFVVYRVTPYATGH